MAGVNVTRPETSLNALESPAVATGTVSSTSTSIDPLAGTVTLDGLTFAVCGLPAFRSIETFNVAGVLPKFFSTTFFFWLKVLSISAKP